MSNIANNYFFHNSYNKTDFRSIMEIILYGLLLSAGAVAAFRIAWLIGSAAVRFFRKIEVI